MLGGESCGELEGNTAITAHHYYHARQSVSFPFDHLAGDCDSLFIGKEAVNLKAKIRANVRYALKNR